MILASSSAERGVSPAGAGSESLAGVCSHSCRSLVRNAGWARLRANDPRKLIHKPIPQLAVQVVENAG